MCSDKQCWVALLSKETLLISSLKLTLDVTAQLYHENNMLELSSITTNKCAQAYLLTLFSDAESSTLCQVVKPKPRHQSEQTKAMLLLLNNKIFSPIKMLLLSTMILLS